MKKIILPLSIIVLACSCGALAYLKLKENQQY